MRFNRRTVGKKRVLILLAAGVLVASGVSLVFFVRSSETPLRITYCRTENPDYGPYLVIANSSSHTVGLFAVQIQKFDGRGWTNWGVPLPFGGLTRPRSFSKLKIDVLGGKPPGPGPWRISAKVDRSLDGWEQAFPRLKLLRQKQPQSFFDKYLAFYTAPREMSFPVYEDGVTNRVE